MAAVAMVLLGPLRVRRDT